MFCKKCGKEVIGQKKFCAFCGAAVSNETQQFFSAQNVSYTGSLQMQTNASGNAFGLEKRQAEEKKLNTKTLFGILAGIVITILLCVGIVKLLQGGIFKSEPTIYDEWICDELSTMSETLEDMLVSNGVNESIAGFVVNDIFQIDALKEIRITFKEDGEVLIGSDNARIVADWLSFEHKEDCLVFHLDITYKGKKIVQTEYDASYRVDEDKMRIDFFGESLRFTRVEDEDGAEE